MKGHFFLGGLGDFIKSCYLSDRYISLADITEKTNVVIASQNDFIFELFKWHPKRHLIHLHNVSAMWWDFHIRGLSDKEFVNFLGIERLSFPRDERRRNVNFYAPDDIADDAKYIVFHPFAGASRRAIPDEVNNLILNVINQLGIKCYIPSRKYIIQDARGKVIHNQEKLSYTQSENIIFLDNLSIPATFNLVKNCWRFIGSHSSLCQLAAMENLKSLILYPKDYPDFAPENLGTKYTSYVKQDTFTIRSFDEITKDDLVYFLFP